MGCLNDLLMFLVVAPVLGGIAVIAFASGDPVLILGAMGVCVLTFGLYLLASWDD